MVTITGITGHDTGLSGHDAGIGGHDRPEYPQARLRCCSACGGLCGQGLLAETNFRVDRASVALYAYG